MTQHADQIRAALEAHEHLAPDSTEVYARAQELARTYRRRRITAQGAGGAVLSVGLVAGGLNLPTLLQGGHAQTKVIQAAAGGSAPAATPLPEDVKRELAAYFGAGYGLQNAKELAKLWNMSSKPSDLDAVKAEAGKRLLAGATLPIKPEAANSAPDAKDTAATTKFFAAGYSYEDAEKLAKLWNTGDPYEAKVKAGQKLLDGKKLPIKPSPEGVSDAKNAAALAAFFKAGYDYDDAVALAKLWKIKSPSDVKVLAGQKLLDGKELPIKPTPGGEETGEATDPAVEAFFKAGYDYDDAVALAKLWKTSSPHEAKVLGGQKLLAGKKLPIKP